MAGPRAVWICCTYRWPKSPGKVICHRFWGDMFVYLQAHLLMQAIATANKQLLSVVMWDNELTSPWSNYFRMLVASDQRTYAVDTYQLRPSERSWTENLRKILSQWKRLLRIRRTYTAPLLFYNFQQRGKTSDWSIFAGKPPMINQ